MQSGIYAIRNLVTGDRYIGSTINFRERWNCHRCDLRNKVHHNRHLTGAWHKHGEANFAFEVLERCQEDVLIAREQYWLDAANKIAGIVTYNLSPIADHRRREMPEAEREQKRQRLLGNLNTYGRVRPKMSGIEFLLAIVERCAHPKQSKTTVVLRKQGKLGTGRKRKRSRLSNLGR